MNHPPTEIFALFGGETFYPHGGVADLKGRFGSRESAIHEAVKLLRTVEYNGGIEWAQVVDCSTFEVVWWHGFTHTYDVPLTWPGEANLNDPLG